MRNPRRTAATASALVVGLALVGLVAIFGDSAKASVAVAVDRGIRADYILKARQFAPFSKRVAEQLREEPALGAVAGFRFGNVRVDGAEETVAGVSFRELRPVVALRLTEGAIRSNGGQSVLVHVDEAKQYGVGVGDEVLIQFPRGFISVEVAGVYKQADFTGGFPVGFVVAQPAYEQGFGLDEQDSLVYVKAAGSRRAAKRAIEDSLGRDFPNVQIFTRAQYLNDQEQAIDRFLAVMVALLFLSEIIAILGIVNTLALSVYERTHELGLLRAVGMSRRQMRRMVRGESVVVALLGGLVGTAVGFLWAWAFTKALRSEGVTVFHVPTAQLVAFIVFSMLAGMAAALGPAWRAAHLDVLRAIEAE